MRRVTSTSRAVAIFTSVEKGGTLSAFSILDKIALGETCVFCKLYQGHLTGKPRSLDALNDLLLVNHAGARFGHETQWRVPMGSGEASLEDTVSS
jgi:hypothetical protein